MPTGTATARLKTLVGPFVLRRLKTDATIIQDLPDKLEMKVYCNLTARADHALPGRGRGVDGADRGGREEEKDRACSGAAWC